MYAIRYVIHLTVNNTLYYMTNDWYDFTSLSKKQFAMFGLTEDSSRDRLRMFPLEENQGFG